MLRSGFKEGGSSTLQSPQCSRATPATTGNGVTENKRAEFDRDVVPFAADAAQTAENNGRLLPTSKVHALRVLDKARVLPSLLGIAICKTISAGDATS